MTFLKLFLKSVVLGSLLLSVASSSAQQKRQATKPARKAPASPTTASSTPTFDTLLSADSYKIYAEVRGVGQLIRSNSVNELLDPVMKLADPPKEFKTLIKWLNAHADEVMTSRMLVATWPTAKDVPDVIVALEFDSSENAAKFEPQLNSFLPKVLPPTPGNVSPEQKPKESAAPRPSHYLKQVGPLILITPSPLTVKNLRPAGSKLLTEDTSFRIARGRFSSESVFVYVNVNGIEAEEQQRRQQDEEEDRKRIAREEAVKQTVETTPQQTSAEEVKRTVEEETPNPEVANPTPYENQAPPATPPGPDPLSLAFGMLTNSFFQGQTKWPDAVGFGVSFDNDSFDVRALMIGAPAQKYDAVPYFPNLIPGPSIVPQSPSVLPADTELLATLSLDLPEIYAAMSKPRDLGSPGLQTVKEIEPAGPFADMEKQLKFKIKDDLLPLIGSEIVVAMPVNLLEDSRPPKSQPTPSDAQVGEKKNSGTATVVVAIALKDKEAMKVLLPKIIESLGFKGASALAKVERQEDTELVSYGEMFSYAFLDDFLIISGNTATTRHVVDSYLRHETLSSDAQFKNFTRWQPHQLQAQVYISPALMESYKTWSDQPGTLFSEQTKELLSRLSTVAQPVTYALSNDGLGTMHELHLPKNLLLLLVAGLSATSNPSPMTANERAAVSTLYTIASAEIRYKSSKGAGSFASMEQLLAEGFLPEGTMQNHGYKIDLTLLGDKFQITAVPDEYGKTGKTSYFIDHSNVLRGSDHGGGVATVEDNPIN